MTASAPKVGAADSFCIVHPATVGMVMADRDFTPTSESKPAKYPGQIGWAFGAAVIVAKDPPSYSLDK